MKHEDYEFFRKETAALKTAFDASYNGINILDSGERTILINKACERIEGITPEDIGEMIKKYHQIPLDNKNTDELNEDLIIHIL